jgi:hypothetical protein
MMHKNVGFQKLNGQRHASWTEKVAVLFLRRWFGLALLWIVQAASHQH